MTALWDLVHILHTRITLQVSVLRYNIKVDSSYLINHSPCQKCRGGCKEHKACTSKQVVTWTCTWNIPSASRAAVSLYNELA